MKNIIQWVALVFLTSTPALSQEQQTDSVSTTNAMTNFFAAPHPKPESGAGAFHGFFVGAGFSSYGGEVVTGSNKDLFGYPSYSFFGGYNHAIGSNIILGAEIGHSKYESNAEVIRSDARTGGARVNYIHNYIGLRAGYVFNKFMPYVTLGISPHLEQNAYALNTSSDKYEKVPSLTRSYNNVSQLSYGFEYLFNPNMVGRAEVTRVHSSDTADGSINADVNAVSIELSYLF